MMPVNKFGLCLQDLVTSANEKYLSLICASSDLIGDLMGASEYLTANCLMELREESHDGQEIKDITKYAKLKGIFKFLEAAARRLIIRTKNTGSGLTVWVLR